MRKPLLSVLAFLSWAGFVQGMPELSQELEAYALAHHYAAVSTEHGQAANEQTIEAKINGRKVTLIVDTGCPRTFVSARAAKRLNLDVHDTGVSNWGLGGKIGGTMGQANIDGFSLSIGEMNQPETVMVFPEAVHLNGSVDGIMGLDFLALNAAILPVGGSGLLLKPGPSPSVSIGDQLRKLGYTPAAFSIATGAMVLAGHINGRPMRFIIDSGAAFSTFDWVSVRAAIGHDLASTELPIQGLDEYQRQGYYFTPSSLDIGGVNFLPGTLMASKTPSFAHEHFNGLLGEDLLGLHRAIIDLADNLLWCK